MGHEIAGTTILLFVVGCALYGVSEKPVIDGLTVAAVTALWVLTFTVLIDIQ